MELRADTEETHFLLTGSNVNDVLYNIYVCTNGRLFIYLNNKNLRISSAAPEDV